MRIGLIVLTIAVLQTAIVPASHAQTAAEAPGCPITVPVSRVEGLSWYKDAGGSVVDNSALREHLELIKPIRDFATDLNAVIDRSDFTCADRMLRRWANGAALVPKPANFAGLREQMRFGMAITLAAARLQAKNHPIPDEVLALLTTLNLSIASQFQRRAVVDNLYVWSGAAAAVAYVLTRDAGLGVHADTVWTSARNAIGADGSVQSELRRKSRGLLYHTYYLAGLVMLEEASGRPMPDAPMTRLYGFVWSHTCPEVSQIAGITAKQEPPSPGDLELIALIGGGEPNFRPPLCIKPRSRVYDPLRGGDIRKLSETFQKLK